MFARIRRILQDLRIGFDYLKYEADARRAWADRAARMFSTTDLEVQRTEVVEAINAERDAKFFAPMEQLRTERTGMATVVADAEGKLAQLTRDYAAELRAIYATLDGLRKSRQECSDQLSVEHDRLAEAKSDLDRWYARAERGWLMGNKGKRLPKYSPIGQDLSDRDGYKRNRDAAAAEIGRLHRERDRIDTEIESTRGRIGEIKAARQGMHDLKKEGFDVRLASGVIRRGKADLKCIDEEIGSLAVASDTYLQEEKHHRGVLDLEAKISEIVARRKGFLAEFETEPARQERKAAHRLEWLKVREVAVAKR